MKTLEYKAVKLSTLKLPGGIRAFLQDKDEPMAESIKELGILQPPLIRKEDGRLLCGRRRIAAAIAAGHETIWIKYVECTDSEAELATLSENAYRQHLSRKEQTDLILEIVKKRAANMKPEELTQGTTGRRRSAESLAMSQVAQQLGINENNLRVAKSRRKKAKEGRSETRPAPQPKTFELVSLGADVSDELNSAASEVAELLGHATRLMRDARGRIQAINTPLPGTSVQALCGSAEELIGALSALAPHSVCPYCKGLQELQKDCTGCDSAGWFGSGQLASAPTKLLDPDDVHVVVDGELTRAVDIFEEDEEQIEDDSDPGIFG